MSDHESLTDRILELAASTDDLAEAGATIARDVGDRAPLEASRVELQELVRRDTGDRAALRGIKIVSQALARLPREVRYDKFNAGRAGFF